MSTEIEENMWGKLKLWHVSIHMWWLSA